MDNDNSNSGVGFLSGLVIGAFAGAVLALVLAPQTGEETRELLGKAQEAKGKALDMASDRGTSPISSPMICASRPRSSRRRRARRTRRPPSAPTTR